ncbi:MAG: hypothetical protein AAF236_05620 [Verrucomicrobiota bacterium]
MEIADTIDRAIEALTEIPEGVADALLDLRDCARHSENPGQCVRCYFAIYHRIAARDSDRLLPLRRWVERHIEVVALAEPDLELERLPLRLDHGDSLDLFCERMMRDFHNDRAYEGESIVLRFDFKREFQAAA